jgi:hypothetical protein
MKGKTYNFIYPVSDSHSEHQNKKHVERERGKTATQTARVQGANRATCAEGDRESPNTKLARYTIGKN